MKAENLNADNQIIKLLCQNGKIFYDLVLPLLNGIDNNIISNEDKTNILRDSYFTYTQKIGTWKNIYKENAIINNNKRDELINNHFTARVSAEKESLKTIHISHDVSCDILKRMLPNYKRFSTNFADILFTMIRSEKFFINTFKESMQYTLHALKKTQHISSISKIEFDLKCDFFKYKFGIALIKCFAIIDFIEGTKNNKEFLTIFNNAVPKYKNPIKMAENIYELFLSYTGLNEQLFSKENLKEFLRIIPCWDNNPSLFYPDTISLNFDIQTLSISEIIEKVSHDRTCTDNDIEKVFSFALKEKLITNDSLTSFVLEIEKIPNYLKEISSIRLKAELLQDSTIEHLTIIDIDLMSGIQFEEFLCQYFNKQGYDCSTTKATGDQGIDLIAKKGELTIAIQAKCYSGTVGNHAVMEAVAGMKYYNANRCMVITNSTFSKSAIELAKANGVILWDRQVLIEKIND